LIIVALVHCSVSTPSPHSNRSGTITMGKRTADNQINKDNFQKVFSEGGDGSIQYGFQKASAEVLKTRRKVAAKM
jgi:hypothetical protein